MPEYVMTDLLSVSSGLHFYARVCCETSYHQHCRCFMYEVSTFCICFYSKKFKGFLQLQIFEF